MSYRTLVELILITFSLIVKLAILLM